MATADALERRSRRRARRKLLWEAVAVFGATALAAVIVYLVYRHPIGSPWSVAGTSVQDISNQPGVQTEVAAAADPSNPNVLFGASNESLEPEVRIYASANAGRTWSEDAGPQHNPNSCAWGDPSVAVGPDGRQYVAFTEKSICVQTDLEPYLVVGSRSGTGAAWTVRRVTHPATKFGFDDKPAITVDSAGRAYVAWSRLYGNKFQTTVVSSTADGGKTWSKPLMVHPRLVQPQLVSAAAGSRGVVYLAGVDGAGLWVARSTNAGRTFTVKRGVAPLPGNQAATCLNFGKFVMPQQTIRCLGPNPTITLGRNRVFVTYGVNGADQTQDVAVAVFDRALQPVWRGPIGPVSTKKGDQFWPASAVDVATGKLWACYYDTTGDSQRQHAWFVCTSSADGRHWTKPVRAASFSEDPGVLWQDATIGGFGDATAYGGYPAVAAAHGVAHPLWIDTRDIGGNREEVFASIVR
jgi:hypothetical protein